MQSQRQVMMIDHVVIFFRTPNDGNQVLAEKVRLLSIGVIAPALALGLHLAHSHRDLSGPQRRDRHGMNAGFSG